MNASLVLATNLQNSAVLDRKVKGLGLPLLYLDFDRVLHPEFCYWHPRKGPYLKAPGHSPFEHLTLLEQLLEPYCREQLSLQFDN